MEQTRPPDVFVIVDNEASLKTRNLIEAFQSDYPNRDVQYVPSPENLGSAGGWALAFAHSIDQTTDADWFVTLDDDDPPIFSDDVERVFNFALEQMAEHPDTGAVGIVGARFNWSRGFLERLSDSMLVGPVEVDYVGNNHLAMYPASVVRKVGGFRKELFFGNTEVEYCLRIKRMGYQIFANGELWKKRREQSNRIGITVRPNRICSDRWKKYYTIRNYIFMMRQFNRLDLAAKQALIQVFLKPIYTLPIDWRLAYRGFRLAVRATIDGLAGNMGRTVKPDDFTSKKLL
jgi:GT2 family glycosyltransferase